MSSLADNSQYPTLLSAKEVVKLQYNLWRQCAAKLERCIWVRGTCYLRNNLGNGEFQLVDDKTIIGGCNIENASYSLSMCAERTALFSAIAQGHKKFISMAIATKTGGMPCGSCRQVIWELCGDIPIFICDNNGIINETSSGALLPAPFDKNHLVWVYLPF